MFEISELKAMKLPELQDIAKDLNVPKYRTMKKLDLVYQILDLQASNPAAVRDKKQDAPEPAPTRGPKPNRGRDRREGGNRPHQQQNGEESTETAVAEAEEPQKQEDRPEQTQDGSGDTQGQQRPHRQKEHKDRKDRKDRKEHKDRAERP